MKFFNIKEILSKYIKDKKIFNIALIFIIGFSLLLLSSVFKEDNKKVEVEENTDLRVIEEERLKNILLSIEDVKKVEVMICFSDTGVKEYYKDESEDIDSEAVKTDKKLVFTRSDGDEVPVLKREISPEIKGVTIVADCKNKSTGDLIYKAAGAALGVDVHKIEVIINDRS